MQTTKKLFPFTLHLAAATALILSLFICTSTHAQEPPPPEDDPWHITEQDLDEAADKIQRQEPDYYKALVEIRRDDVDEYRELIEQWIFEQLEIQEIKKFEPEMFEKVFKPMADLQKKERSLAARYRLAEGAGEKDAIKKELMSTLDKLFDLKLQRQRTELKELEERLEELKNDIKRREENKSKIIQRRFEELAGIEEELHW